MLAALMDMFILSFSLLLFLFGTFGIYFSVHVREECRIGFSFCFTGDILALGLLDNSANEGLPMQEAR